jgi:hypothetical protein
VRNNKTQNLCRIISNENVKCGMNGERDRVLSDRNSEKGDLIGGLFHVDMKLKYLPE